MSSIPLVFDRVMETSSISSVASYPLTGAVPGYRDFSVVGDGNSCHYCAQAVDANGNPSGDWEIGLGTYSASNSQLSRDTIYQSSRNNVRINWPNGGQVRVFLCAPAATMVETDRPNVLTQPLVVQGVDVGAALGQIPPPMPTAPVGQVLVSQGAGVPPVFSNSPVVARLDASTLGPGGGAILLPNELYFDGIKVLKRDNLTGNLHLAEGNGAIVVPERPFASLIPSPVIGTLANVSDSPRFWLGGIITSGGGPYHVIVRWDGANWIIIGGGIGDSNLYAASANFDGSVSLTSFAAALHVEGFIRLREAPFASRPTSDQVGNLANFSDSVSSIVGAVVVGGGTNHVLARWDGTQWVVVGGVANRSLPTAPVDQLLASQGDGVIPTFTNNPVVSGLAAHYALTCLEGNVNAFGIHFAANFTVAQVTPGEFVGNLLNLADSTTKTPGAIIVGGGSFNVLGRWNGTNWIVIGG
jgi:hypothetical protein